MSGKIEARLKELGIELPLPAAPVANYVPFTVSGNLVFVSGQLCQWNGELRFVGKLGAKPEIWSYGHRNSQGAAINPVTGKLWEHEHGPRGGDEINIARKGKNYGWPTISYGVNYGPARAPIPDFTR